MSWHASRATSSIWQPCARPDLISKEIKRVKIIASGELDRAMTLRGLGVTKGARAAIEAAGGKVED